MLQETKCLLTLSTHTAITDSSTTSFNSTNSGNTEPNAWDKWQRVSHEVPRNSSSNSRGTHNASPAFMYVTSSPLPKLCCSISKRKPHISSSSAFETIILCKTIYFDATRPKSGRRSHRGQSIPGVGGARRPRWRPWPHRWAQTPCCELHLMQPPRLPIRLVEHAQKGVLRGGNFTERALTVNAQPGLGTPRNAPGLANDLGSAFIILFPQHVNACESCALHAHIPDLFHALYVFKANPRVLTSKHRAILPPDSYPGATLACLLHVPQHRALLRAIS